MNDNVATSGDTNKIKKQNKTQLSIKNWIVTSLNESPTGHGE